MTAWSPPRAEGHFNAQRSEIIGFLIGGAVFADAEADGGRHAGGVDDLPDVVEQEEFLFDHARQQVGLKHKKVSVAFDLTEQAARPFCPAPDGVVDGDVEGGDVVVREIIGEFIVIIHQNDGHHRPGPGILLFNGQIFRHIDKIEVGQPGRGGVAGEGDNVAVDVVAAASEA